MNSLICIIILIIILILSILSTVGLIWLTQFSFTAKKDGESVTVVKFDSRKLIFCKIAVVLSWINIGLIILVQIIELTVKK